MIIFCSEFKQISFSNLCFFAIFFSTKRINHFKYSPENVTYANVIENRKEMSSSSRASYKICKYYHDWINIFSRIHYHWAYIIININFRFFLKSVKKWNNICISKLIFRKQIKFLYELLLTKHVKLNRFRNMQFKILLHQLWSVFIWSHHIKNIFFLF